MTTLYDIDRLQDALRYAKNALALFGQHDIQCEKVLYMALGGKPAKCSCGLDDAIEKLSQEIDKK